MDGVVLVRDSIHVFYHKRVAETKVPLFFELIPVLLYILIIKKKDILVLTEGPTEGLDDIITIAEAE